MSGQDQAKPLVNAVTCGQDVVIELTVPVEHLKAAHWDHDPTYGPTEPLIVETRLTPQDLADYVAQQVCSWDCCQNTGPGPYEELLESVIGDLHRLAHNEAGDTDDAARCLRYPCRRLSE